MNIKRIGKIAYYGFLAILGVIALLVIFSVFPIPGNYQIRVVRSGSMEPAAPMGSVVVTKPSSAYRIGDIITFSGSFRGPAGERIPTTHRIVDMEVLSGSPRYITKGDANENPDQAQVQASQIIGKVLFAVPYIGYGVEAARTPYGFLALIIIPAAIIIVDQGKSVWAEIKRISVAKKIEQIESNEKEMYDL